MQTYDLGEKIQRLEAFEERLGVRLEAISAFLYPESDYEEEHVVVRGELHAAEGTELRCCINVFATAYDTQGRVIQSEDVWFNDEKFFGFEVFEIRLDVAGPDVGKIRLFPK